MPAPRAGGSAGSCCPAAPQTDESGRAAGQWQAENGGAAGVSSRQWHVTADRHAGRMHGTQVQCALLSAHTSKLAASSLACGCPMRSRRRSTPGRASCTTRQTSLMCSATLASSSRRIMRALCWPRLGWPLAGHGLAGSSFRAACASRQAGADSGAVSAPGGASARASLTAASSPHRAAMATSCNASEGGSGSTPSCRRRASSCG